MGDLWIRSRDYGIDNVTNSVTVEAVLRGPPPSGEQGSGEEFAIGKPLVLTPENTLYDIESKDWYVESDEGEVHYDNAVIHAFGVSRQKAIAIIDKLADGVKAIDIRSILDKEES